MKNFKCLQVEQLFGLRAFFAPHDGGAVGRLIRPDCLFPARVISANKVLRDLRPHKLHRPVEQHELHAAGMIARKVAVKAESQRAVGIVEVERRPSPVCPHA